MDFVWGVGQRVPGALGQNKYEERSSWRLEGALRRIRRMTSSPLPLPPPSRREGASVKKGKEP